MRPFALAMLFTLACTASSAPATGFPADAYASVTSPSGMYSFEIRTAPQPPARGAIPALVTVKHDGAPADGLILHVTPWMPAMGHGASVEPTLVPRGNGDYLVEDLVLPMPGTWELRISMSDGSEPTVLALSVE